MKGSEAVASRLLLSARRRRQWSQAELARRTGLPASQICAYETGTKQPTVATLARILAVAGVELSSAEAATERERQARELEDVLGLVDAMTGPRRADRPQFGPFTTLLSR